MYSVVGEKDPWLMLPDIIRQGQGKLQLPKFLSNL
jgi:hypothetical protein